MKPGGQNWHHEEVSLDITMVRWQTSAGSGVLRLSGTLAVNQPRDAEAINKLAKALGPECFLESGPGHSAHPTDGIYWDAGHKGSQSSMVVFSICATRWRSTEGVNGLRIRCSPIGSAPLATISSGA
jgi:hypothetical protein